MKVLLPLIAFSAFATSSFAQERATDAFDTAAMEDCAATMTQQVLPSAEELRLWVRDGRVTEPDAHRIRRLRESWTGSAGTMNCSYEVEEFNRRIHFSSANPAYSVTVTFGNATVGYIMDASLNGRGVAAYGNGADTAKRLLDSRHSIVTAEIAGPR